MKEVKVLPGQVWTSTSDGKDYRVSRLTPAKGKEKAVVGLTCLNCSTKSGEAIQTLDDFQKVVSFGLFILKP